MNDDSDDKPTDADIPDGASGDRRLMAPADAGQQPRLPFPVVGIGASAGGLEAYTEFLKAMPADSGMAFVLVQHLSPDRESLVADILARHTAMPVLQVEDGQAVEPDHVYIIRPGHTMTIRDGRLHLGARLDLPGHNRPVDDFFRSLADEQQQRAIALIFSGMGSNGTAGAQAIKAVGGLCIAQEPQSAKYPSMPRSLLDANLADYVLRPEEIPPVIIRYASHPYAAGRLAPGTLSPHDTQPLNDILAVVRARTRHDFSGYRKPTIVRRVQRRMGLNQIEDIGAYARTLRQNLAEATALADDLLIHVTGFFRDPEAWAALGEKVIGPLVAERDPDTDIRAWVTACATGEEAYTLAMLLAEAAEAAGKHFDIKVFATDMAERALGAARAGIFPGGIESEITPERLARFFDRDDVCYRVKRELREMVVFAPQNVLEDPPFSRLDIATCRNLLIYLEPEVQQRVITLMHFGLRDGGTLMLGTSESAGEAADGFEPIDKKSRLYRRVGPTRRGVLDFPLPPAHQREAFRERADARSLPRASIAQVVNRTLLERHTPAAVVVDPQGQVAYFHGNTGRYLTMPAGEPTRDLLSLAIDEVRGAVQAALRRAAGLGEPVTVRDGVLDTPDGRRRVIVGAGPLEARGGQRFYLVTFTDFAEPAPAGAGAGGGAGDGNGNGHGEQRLTEELGRVRAELLSTVQDLQTNVEEMKASNEEVISVNEELQSANEELETSKEELQSLNEELTTVNVQLQVKMEELEKTGNDLASLLSSTDIAVIFLDLKFRIRRFTPAVRDLIDTIPGDLGRPLADLRRKFADPDLAADAVDVLERMIPVEREVTSDSGRWYLRRVLPYRTADYRIDGVVVTFVDITQRKAAEAAVRAGEEQLRVANATLEARIAERTREHWVSEQRFRALVEASSQIVWSMNPAGEMDADSPTWRAFTGQTPEQMADRGWAAAVHPDDRAAAVAAWEAAAESSAQLDVEYRLRHAGGGYRWTHARGVPLADPDGSVRGWVGMSSDITAKKDAAAARAELLRRLSNAQEEERRRVARDLHDQVGQTLTALTLAVHAVRDAGPLPKAAAAKLTEVIKAADELGRDLHTIAVRLRPTALDDLGLPAALGQLLAVWSARSKVAYDLETDGLTHVRFPPEAETILYRVVQEALTNVARHAKAKRVGVVVERHLGHAVAVIEDDGVGFDPEAASGRLGLVGMRERVALAGGSLVIESEAGKGTTVIARVPIN